MTAHRGQRGATLAIGLILLLLVTLLGLAGASGAHLELMLANHEQFRENAATAASTGIEFAISRIVNTSVAPAAAHTDRDYMPGSATDRWETHTRFAGFERDLPQRPGDNVIGAHFEIVSTGHAARRAIDRQRLGFMLVLPATRAAPTDAAGAQPIDCEAREPVLHCWQAGQSQRVFWQRMPDETP